MAKESKTVKIDETDDIKAFVSAATKAGLSKDSANEAFRRMQDSMTDDTFKTVEISKVNGKASYLLKSEPYTEDE